MVGNPPEWANNSAGPRGRPRSGAAHRAILTAAYAELKRVGFRGLTMAAIAHEAGVSKATVYRRWASKEALLFDAVNSDTEHYPEFRTGDDTREVLREEIRGVISYFRTDTGSAFLDLVSESRFDDSLARALSEEFVAGRREATQRVLTEAASHGRVRDDLDVETLMDMVWGAVYYRFLVLHETPPPDFADQLLDQAWPLIEQPRA